MKTQCTLENREGDVLVSVSPDAEHHIDAISQVIESCYYANVFDKPLWNNRYVEPLNGVEGVTAYSYNPNTGEVA